MDRLGYLLLGWILGIFSPLIHDLIRNFQAKKALKEGIFSELKELKLRMAASVFQLSVRYLTFDRESLNWILKHSEELKGKQWEPILTGLRDLTKLNDGELATESKAFQAQHKGSSLNLKPYRVPFIDSSMDKLSSLGSEDQEKIIEIHARINLLNDDVNEMHSFFEKTFVSGLTPENDQIIQDNLNSLRRKANGYLRDIVDIIDDLISK